MKFWKTVLLTTCLFFGFSSLVLYTSCEKDPCAKVTCLNGGSCNIGACKCPTAFEGPTCATQMISRFIGYYAGYSTCNNGAELIDTVFIYGNVPHQNATVLAVLKSHPYEPMYGVVTNNETTYSMSIPDLLMVNYYKMYHITLQSDSKLILNTYERDTRVPGDTVINKCTFIGTKHAY